MVDSPAPLKSWNAQAGCVPEVQKNCSLILWMRYPSLRLETWTACHRVTKEWIGELEPFIVPSQWMSFTEWILGLVLWLLKHLNTWHWDGMKEARKWNIEVNPNTQTQTHTDTHRHTHTDTHTHTHTDRQTDRHTHTHTHTHTLPLQRSSPLIFRAVLSDRREGSYCPHFIDGQTKETWPMISSVATDKTMNCLSFNGKMGSYRAVL